MGFADMQPSSALPPPPSSLCRVQIGGDKGSLFWDDLCIPRREDVCEFRVCGSGGFSMSGVEQSVEVKKVCPVLQTASCSPPRGVLWGLVSAHKGVLLPHACCAC